MFGKEGKKQGSEKEIDLFNQLKKELNLPKDTKKDVSKNNEQKTLKDYFVERKDVNSKSFKDNTQKIIGVIKTEKKNKVVELKEFKVTTKQGIKEEKSTLNKENVLNTNNQIQDAEKKQIEVKSVKEIKRIITDNINKIEDFKVENPNKIRINLNNDDERITLITEKIGRVISVNAVVETTKTKEKLDVIINDIRMEYRMRNTEIKSNVENNAKKQGQDQTEDKSEQKQERGKEDGQYK